MSPGEIICNLIAAAFTPDPKAEETKRAKLAATDAALESFVNDNESKARVIAVHWNDRITHLIVEGIHTGERHTYAHYDLARRPLIVGDVVSIEVRKSSDLSFAAYLVVGERVNNQWRATCQ